jgi:hypothetical protein
MTMRALWLGLCVWLACVVTRGQEVPQDGLVLWLKADAVTGVASGAAFANWLGSAGTPAASRPAVEHQPRWIADGLNGKPVVRFDGNDALVTPATIGLPRAHTFVAVVVDRTTDDNGVFLWFEDEKGTPGPAFGSGAMGKSLRVRNYPGQAQTPLAPAAGLYALIADADGVHVYRNGISSWMKLENGWSGTFPGGGTRGRFVIGQHGGGVGQYLKGDVAELIAYGRAITPAERRGIEAYLIQKYRLPIAAPKPAVLCIGNGDPYSYIATRLANDHGIQLGVCEFGEVTWEKLVQYNVVILFDMSRLNPDTRSDNAVEISPAGFQRVGDLLERFVQSGSGLYLYGVSFTHMGQGWANQTLNRLLQRFNGRVAFEMLHDSPKESRQPEGQKVLYALADHIVAHPATAGVRNVWFAVGPFSYGPWTRPLILGPEWTPLIRTSPGFKATPIDPDKGWDSALAGAVSEVKEPTAVIYAARTFGQGRVVLNGGESTISFFGYGYSPFADKAWGRIGMEEGLNGIPSDGLQLFVSSLKWLAQPTIGLGDFGGYVVPPKPLFTPRRAQPIAWEPAKPVGGELKYYKGVFGAVPALGGGTGTVAEWVAAAKTQGLQYLVLCGDCEQIEKPAWEQLVAECRAASNDDFAATAALITRDDQNNSFLQCGSKLWPRELRLSKKNPKRVQDHLGYWIFQLTAAEDGKSETRPVVHQINRPYENADMIIFDTPLLRRGTGETGEIYGHAPYLNLAEPKVAARLVQWHPYRNPALPAAVMGELSITVTDPGGVQLKNGFAGLSVHLASSPGWYKVFKRYMILRAESTASEVDGPAPDDAKDTSYNGRLNPGDLILLPDLGEGLFVLDGTPDLALACANVKNPLGLFWLGHAGTEKLATGARISTKLLLVNLKTKGTQTEAILANWIRFRDQYGIGGKSPGYAVTAKQGSVAKSRFLLELVAHKYGFQGTIGQADLPQRLSIKISGLNPKWTAAKVDLVRQQWFPLGVWDGAAYTTVDTTEGEHQLYVGNIVTCDNPDVWLTLLPANADGKTRVDVHNPTDQDVTVIVCIPVATSLAAQQSFTVAVPKGTTVRRELH